MFWPWPRSRLTLPLSQRARTYVKLQFNDLKEDRGLTRHKQVIIKWRGKPVFIRHRTASEIQEAENIKVETLRDPQTDAERVKKPEWLVMVGT